MEVNSTKEIFYAPSDLERTEWIDAVMKYSKQLSIDNAYEITRSKEGKLGEGPDPRGPDHPPSTTHAAPNVTDPLPDRSARHRLPRQGARDGQDLGRQGDGQGNPEGGRPRQPRGPRAPLTAVSKPRRADAEPTGRRRVLLPAPQPPPPASARLTRRPSPAARPAGVGIRAAARGPRLPARRLAPAHRLPQGVRREPRQASAPRPRPAFVERHAGPLAS